MKGRGKKIHGKRHMTLVQKMMGKKVGGVYQSRRYAIMDPFL